MLSADFMISYKRCWIERMLHISLIIWISDESRQMFCLNEDCIQISISKAYTKFDFFWIRQVLVGFEFSACVYIPVSETAFDIL